MTTRSDIGDTIQFRQLARVAALSLQLAEELAARAMAAEADETAAALAKAYNSVVRGMRMSILAQNKLVRDQRNDERETARDLRRELELNPERQTRRRAQRGEICDVIEPLIWNEHEYLDAKELQTRFNVWLDAEMARPGFENENTDAMIWHVVDMLGLKLNPDEDDPPAGPAAHTPVRPAADSS